MHPDRVIFCEADKEEDVLALMEEGLAYGGLGAVVGELVRLPKTASRRLQLAAERTGTMGIALRRWRRQAEASDYGQPTASTTRWRVSVLQSEPLSSASVLFDEFHALDKAGRLHEVEIVRPEMLRANSGR